MPVRTTHLLRARSGRCRLPMIAQIALCLTLLLCAAPQFAVGQTERSESRSSLGLTGSFTEPWAPDEFVEYRGASYRFGINLGMGIIAGSGSAFNDFSGGLALHLRTEFWPVYSPNVSFSMYAQGSAAGFVFPLLFINVAVWGLYGEIGGTFTAGSQDIALYTEFAYGGRVGGAFVDYLFGGDDQSSTGFSYLRLGVGARIHTRDHDGFDFVALFEWPDVESSNAFEIGGAIHYWMHNGVRISFELFPWYAERDDTQGVFVALLFSKTIDWFGSPYVARSEDR